MHNFQLVLLICILPSTLTGATDNTNGNELAKSSIETTTVTYCQDGPPKCDSRRECPEGKGLHCNTRSLDPLMCACNGNMIYSKIRCACKIQAGGRGCRISGDCTDGAHCFHKRKRCRYRQTLWADYVQCSSADSMCHCCIGELYGDSKGECLPATPEECSSGSEDIKFLKSKTLQICSCILFIILTL